MALTAGTLSQVSVTQVSDSLLASAVSGGTTPYSYQWYRSTSSGFTPGTANLLAGATALALADNNLTPSTIYYYKVIGTDSAGTPLTATYAQLAVTTLASTFAQLPLTTIVAFSIATPQQGVGQFNTGNLCIFTRDAYGSSFPSAQGYQIYLSATQVGTDFGTLSNTYKMALGIFSQQPNILNNNGYLVIIPFLTPAQVAVQQVSFVGGTGAPVSGAFTLSYGAGNTSASIAYNASAATIQAALQALSGLGSVTVSGSIGPTGLTVTFVGVSGAATLLTVGSNTLVDVNSVTVVPTPVTTTIGAAGGETLDHAINRTIGLVSYFGVMAAEITSQVVQLAAAAVIQANNMLGFFTSYTQADVGPGGMLTLLQTGGFTQSRAVPYFEISAANQPTTSLVYMASYAALGMSTNFSGSLTTQTLQLKGLSGVQPDPSMNPSLYVLCQTAGADVYASVQGVSKILTSGQNDFFDNQFNLQWFIGALRTASFNVLATTNTKVPQTENGMNLVKNALRQVCEQAVANGFLAPGVWTSPTTFGNQQNLYKNIASRGYYIYSSPISQQLPASRSARQAPLIQIAIKYAGAVQSLTGIVYVNP